VECAGLAGWLAGHPKRVHGEFVLVLHAAPQAPAADEGLRVLKLLLQDLPVKTAVRLAAEISGAGRNDLYQAALSLKSAAPSGP
jgi:16S rRNA (cytidine1402-2'-O)-methyltransferase